MGTTLTGEAKSPPEQAVVIIPRWLLLLRLRWLRPVGLLCLWREAGGLGRMVLVMAMDTTDTTVVDREEVPRALEWTSCNM